MGTKIVQLPPAPTLEPDDLIPISKIVDSVRDTYKTTANDLSNFITADILEIIDNNNTNNNNTINNLNSKFLPLTGGTMAGDINLNNKKITKFSGDIKTVTGDIFLTQDYNGSIILVNKSPLVTPDDRVLLKINVDTLKIGFNALIIQTGDVQAKIGNPDGKVDLVNADKSLSTRTKYSQMNVVVIENQAGVKDTVWLSGDIV